MCNGGRCLFHQFTPVATLPHRIFFSLNREGAKDAKGFLRVMGDGDDFMRFHPADEPPAR